MALKDLFKRVDEKLGSPVRGILESRNARRRMARFADDLRKRREKYNGRTFNVTAHEDILNQIKANGFAHIKQAVDVERIRKLRAEFEQHLDNGSCMLPVSKDSARTPGDKSAASTFFTEDEERRGQQFAREHTNFMALSEPFLNCPAAVPLAFDDLLIDVACRYLECVPAIGGINLRKSFANKLPEFDTLYFHVDPNSPKFLKFFYYLNDVDDNGGPFCFVKGSHAKRFRGWQRKYRWTFDEMAEIYGEDKILKLTAKAGDVIVADTNGFHRGTKVVTTDRSMLTVDYVIHTEFEGQQKPFKLSRASFEALSERKKAAADFLEVLE